MIYLNRIKELREDMDMRQIDVSEKTGIDQRTLSNYETGKTSPDSFAIITLANLFGVSTDYLLGVSDTRIATTKEILQRVEKLQNELDELIDTIKKLY